MRSHYDVPRSWARILPAALALCGLAAVGCSSESGKPGAASPGAMSEGDPAAVVEIRGAGASFPALLYQKWAKEYGKARPNVKVEYTSNGSGAGIKQFTEKLVLFGASDAAMTDEEIKAVPEGVQLLPMTAGSIVLTYNLKDAEGKPIANLKLPRAAYAGIFLGDVKVWNDKLIADANPGVNLPEKPISVVYRADSSGTTYVFTQHLSAISEKWKAGPGTNKSVKWPVGSGANKNDGVAGGVKQNEGAIGYVEYGFAFKTTGVSMARLENKAGKYPEANLDTAAVALASVPAMPADLRVWLPDPEGEGAYPIVSYTWILARRQNADAAQVKPLKDFLKWCLTDGQKASAELGYIPLPETVSAKVLAALENVK